VQENLKIDAGCPQDGIIHNAHSGYGCTLARVSDTHIANMAPNRRLGIDKLAAADRVQSILVRDFITAAS